MINLISFNVVEFCIICRCSDAENLEFNLRELTEPTKVKTDNKSSSKAGRQFDSRLGVGDTVTVMTSRTTDVDNKVAAVSFCLLSFVNLKPHDCCKTCFLFDFWNLTYTPF